MARRSVEPSTMSLLGLVRHLAEMERGFRVLMAGQDVPRLYCSDTDRDGDFDGAVPDPGWLRRRGTRGGRSDFATRFVAEAPSLDITGDDPLNPAWQRRRVDLLREMLVGTIEEYARHMGHADLLRERIDGRIGQVRVRAIRRVGDRRGELHAMPSGSKNARNDRPSGTRSRIGPCSTPRSSSRRVAAPRSARVGTLKLR